ncbi:hypothetical protein FYJ24_05255 [Actinomycetaceae bacterium WB03_NA08]|uniref:Uncharacterized protein n=1 Tax=Scrofimicrobium canadense TaxID=2652290 RepID=A0A6N7W6R2_9ACTO|nr:hypothetical protein [Scrofimicrobium canadense]MSS84183.1 hypothetical protein [Scrofimicrobium canadense]
MVLGYQALHNAEAINLEMGRFAGLGDFVSQVGALRHDVALAVRELAEGFSDVDVRLLRGVIAEEVGRYFSERLSVPRTTVFDVFDRLGVVELRDVGGRLASVLAEELDHEQAGEVAALWDSHLDTHGCLTVDEQVGLAVKYLRDRGGLRDVGYLLDAGSNEAERG